MRLTTGDIIADSLVRNGVDTVFGIPGAHMYDFNDALARRADRVRFVHTRHEQAAGFMAYGHARSTGRPGVYTVVPGPGLLNSGAALATAYGANAPVMCITGNIVSGLVGRGRGQLHELPDHLATLRGLTRWAARINHPSEAARIMARAFGQMRSGRQGPVGVETPWDVLGQDMPGPVEHPDAPVAPPPPPDPVEIERAVRLIAGARRPLVMVGGGALHAGGEIAELARRLDAPVTAHRAGKGVVPEDDDHFLMPPAAWDYWQRADLLVGIGSRLELQHFRWRWFPPGLRTVRIDIDPTEFVRLPADAPVLADAAAGVRALLEALPTRIRHQTSGSAERAALRRRAALRVAALEPQASFLGAIRDALPPDGFFVEEVCQAGFTARLSFPVSAPRLYVSCGYQETLGFGFPTALGVKVANPDRAVLGISGDGGFLFGVQELATAVQHGINVVMVVFDNGAYGNVLRDQRERYGNRILGAALHNPDFVALAESFGALGLRADEPDALRRAIRDAFEADRPAVIVVPVRGGVETSPWPLLHPAPPEGRATEG